MGRSGTGGLSDEEEELFAGYGLRCCFGGREHVGKLRPLRGFLGSEKTADFVDQQKPRKPRPITDRDDAIEEPTQKRRGWQFSGLRVG